jgi:hypothetical protein
VSIKTDVKCFILTKESTVFSFHDQGRRWFCSGRSHFLDSFRKESLHVSPQ